MTFPIWNAQWTEIHGLPGAMSEDFSVYRVKWTDLADGKTITHLIVAENFESAVAIASTWDNDYLLEGVWELKIFTVVYDKRFSGKGW